jgi:GMP synthase-like glutamine amidotransferase
MVFQKKKGVAAMKIHYLQHVPFENPGIILDWAERNGHIVTSTQLYKGRQFPLQSDFDWLVIMGGPMNIYQEDQYPWLAEEKAFIRASINAGKVGIGLCLGAQLLADVLGGKVTRNPYTEIGWFPVRMSSQALQSDLFSFFPPDPMVFHWHGDTFSQLPPDAELIAENEACSHQAFVYKNRVFGFQYHMENTMEIIRNLITNCADEMAPDTYVQSPNDILAGTDYIRQDNMWMSEFLTRLEKKG